jgi:hypothetical protein
MYLHWTIALAKLKELAKIADRNAATAEEAISHQPPGYRKHNAALHLCVATKTSWNAAWAVLEAQTALAVEEAKTADLKNKGQSNVIRNSDEIRGWMKIAKREGEAWLEAVARSHFLAPDPELVTDQADFRDESKNEVETRRTTWLKTIPENSRIWIALKKEGVKLK